MKKEIEVVKDGMGHDDLPDHTYQAIWEECYGEVLFIPSQKRYTRASMASTKDKLEGLELKLQVGERKEM